MLQRGQDAPLGCQLRRGALIAQAGQQFDRHLLGVQAIGTLGQVDHPHATARQALLQLPGPDPVARAQLGLVDLADQPADPFAHRAQLDGLRPQQPQRLAHHPGIAAQLVEPGLPLFGRQVTHLIKQVPDLLPFVLFHPHPPLP